MATGHEIIAAFSTAKGRSFNEYGEHVQVPVLVEGSVTSIGISLQSQISFSVLGEETRGARKMMASVHFMGSITHGAEWLNSVTLIN